MSWEAVAWANRQKMKKSFEQIILLVVANNADANGEAFTKWPGRDHWWIYLSEKTRLPKSSLFRHLNTIMALGLGCRTEQVLADGARRPTFKLNMEASFDIEDPEDAQRYEAVFAKGSAENQSPVETGEGEVVEGDENDNDISHSQAAENEGASQSRVETGKSLPETGAGGPIPSAGTDPFPVLGTHRDSNLVPKTPPLPPSGGTRAPDELFDEFVKSWREPIPKMALAQAAWDRIETAKRPTVVAAAKGYFAWIAGNAKPPTPVSAQSFLRDDVGWEQWLRFVPADGAVVPIAGAYPVASREGKAICRLHEIAGLGDFLARIMIRNGLVSYRNPMTPRLAALGDMTRDRSEWVRLTHQQAAAWEGFVGQAVTTRRIRKLAEGDLAPDPWPPSREGRRYTTDPPPDQLMTDQDYNDFKS